MSVAEKYTEWRICGTHHRRGRLKPSGSRDGCRDLRGGPQNRRELALRAWRGKHPRPVGPAGLTSYRPLAPDAKTAA